MGRKSTTGGVIGRGHDRIQFDFTLDGVRYRPTLKRRPTEANLRQAREYLKDIKARIRAGTFSFAEEFPDFRDLHRVVDGSQLKTCGQIFDAFLDHCEARVARNDLSVSTLDGYCRSLDTAWRPHLGRSPFLAVRFQSLCRIANSFKAWSKKTYNNNLCALRCAFSFGYYDHPQVFNPALGLRFARLSAREQPRPDPFRIHDAEMLIAAIHRDWGEAQGNFDEFRFFTGLRLSEEIALTVRDFDPLRATLSVTKARVKGIDRNCTKTRVDRVIELCPRAAAVLARHLRLREELVRSRLIDHDNLFFQANGASIRTLHYPTYRWRATLTQLPVRYRKAYATRHTSVSWNLAIGTSPLRVAKDHGHSVATMWRVYAAWMQGAVDADIETIKCAMQAQDNMNGPSPAQRVAAASGVRRARRAVPRMDANTKQRIRRGRRRTRLHLALDLPLAAGGAQLSPGIYWEITGGADRTRTENPL
jgi:integrase